MPQRPGDDTGYSDRELAPSRYRVTFAGNSVMPREMVENYLLLRAAEVALAAGATYFEFDSRDIHKDTRIYAGPIGPHFGSGFYRGFYGPYGGWACRLRWGYGLFGPPVMITQITRYQAYAEILLLCPGQERNEPGAVDARAIIDHLSPSAARSPVQGAPHA